MQKILKLSNEPLVNELAPSQNGTRISKLYDDNYNYKFTQLEFSYLILLSVISNNEHSSILALLISILFSTFIDIFSLSILNISLNSTL